MRMKPGNSEIHIYVATAPVPTPEDAQLARELAAHSDIDPYTIRQRLQGCFPAYLTKGPEDKIQRLAAVLGQYKRHYWIFTPTPVSMAPETIKGLEISADSVVLSGSATSINCTPDQTLLAIVADVSGQIGAQHLKRLMVRHTYGASTAQHVDVHELEQEIFRLAPCIDLYRLNKNGTITAGIRILPGSFNHRQLGADASLSRQRNLRILWEKIRACAPGLRVHYGFGMAFLPGCSPETVDVSAAYAHRGNLEALSRYAWLMHDMHRAEAAGNSCAQTSAASGIDANPVAPHMLNTEAAEVPGRLFGTLQQQQDAGPENNTSTTAQTQEHLPTPPEPETISGLALHFSGPRLLLSGIAIALVLCSSISSEMHSPLEHYLLNNGMGPLLLAALGFYTATKYMFLKRRIENTPTSKIRSMAMGMVEAHGQAKRLYALVSPISSLPCVYYRIKKYRRKRFASRSHMFSSRSDSQWALVSITSSNSVPFLLEDETGAVQVNPAGARLQTRTNHSGYGSGASLPFMRNEEHNENERWEEEVIPAGTHVYILGFAQHAPTAPPTQTLREELQQLKTDPSRMQQYDTNADGHIDAEEWDQARKDMQNRLLLQQLDNAETSTGAAFIGKPPQRNYPFFIAETESELHLTRKLTYYIAISSAAGVAFAGWGLYAAARTLHLF